QKHPKLYLPYTWLSEPLFQDGDYEVASEIIEEGLSKAEIKSYLAMLMGWIKYKECDLEKALGWFMQSCLLATEQVMPYILCAAASDEFGYNKLSCRLLNAKDVIDTSMKESPQDEAAIRRVSQECDIKKLRSAFGKFEKYLDPYLPGENDIPKYPDYDSRGIFLSSRSLDKDGYVRRAKAKLLRLDLRAKLDFSHLIERLKNEDRNIRQDASEALRELNDPLSVAPLLEALKNEILFKDRPKVIWSLAWKGNSKAAMALMELLTDEDVDVRQAAATVLGRIQDTCAVEALIDTLKDPVLMVRSSAAFSLGIIGDPRALTPLKELKDISEAAQKGKSVMDDDSYIYATISNAIDKINQSK
ncbi:MAG TPA: HEAT repeat domain-containing protein, partial [Spirochaetes bacterium]|nr:HEAT repeat domain-containing protein [Spirochaetota bacterium]